MSDSPGDRESLERRLASLSPAKRALLELRLKQARVEAPNGLPRIVRRGPRSAAPLSFAQQRLWFLDQLQPGRPLYNVPCRAWLHGPLDVSALHRALEEIVARHESLRTTFPATNGQPVQAIVPGMPFELTLVDLTSVPAERQEAEVRRLATEQARQPFDLARGPLLRARLLRLADDEHALVLMLHHIVADGWSVGVLFRELGTLYEAFSQGRTSPLPDLPIQYADYAATQREWLQGAVLEHELNYWRARFLPLPAPLQLPADRPRPSTPTHAGARVHFRLSPPLRERLDELSRAHGATLFMTLLAGFKVLLAQSSGQDDIVVGTPIAGRTRAETEGLIGCFVNTLALRTDLSGDPTFLEVLARVRETALGAYAHQELPFERLVEELQPERDTSQAPLFNVMFVLQNVPRTERRLQGLTIRHIELDKGTSKFDLSLGLAEKAGGLRAVLSYSTDRFDRRTIERLVSRYQTLLASVAEAPDSLLSALPMVDAEERRMLLHDWNGTRHAWAEGDACLHSLVTRRAATSPDAVAVTDGAVQLTYAELECRADRLAQRLRELGVGPEVRVAACLERSADLVVGLLGILKAGGAYVPLDPAYPLERLEFMLRDSGARLLLTQEHLRKTIRSEGVQVVCDDGGRAPLAAAPADLQATGSSADNLAYVMYTSGSTGRPKGVMVSHRAALNHLRWRETFFPLAPGDRGLHKSSVSFDDSVWEIFEPLLAGARLILARPDGQSDAPYLARLIVEQRVTTACFVPTLLRAFLEEPDVERCASLRRVTTGGEALSPELQEQFFARLGTASLHNGYGPTEATVSATFWTCERESGRGWVPIGRPIANTRVYVLDRHLRLVPVGTPGELYIAGESLARGYLDRPGLTAERFLPDPFADGVGARMYRTGDRARWRPDGTLEFLGRVDHQVKIRGFRVEPGEVAATLAAYPGVADTVVIAREDDRGSLRLIAYLVPAGGALPFDGEVLRDFLRARLPEPMIPWAFVLLEAMPLTPNGKVDIQALPAPTGASPTAEHMPPTTAIEQAIAGIWTPILRVERIGIQDNFFALGGHSLLAAQVVARMRTAFGFEVPLRALFETPTIAGLAGRVEETVRLIEEVATLMPESGSKNAVTVGSPPTT